MGAPLPYFTFTLYPRSGPEQEMTVARRRYLQKFPRSAGGGRLGKRPLNDVAVTLSCALLMREGRGTERTASNDRRDETTERREHRTDSS